jgi:hypothetical protein
MSGSLNMGNLAVPNDPMLAKAFCEGRRAKYAGALSTANPHGATTPAGEAWARGWGSYTAGGTLKPRDCCADLPSVPTGGDFDSVVADMTVTVTATPAVPFTIDWGDGGAVVDDADGTAAHTYAAEGDYWVRVYFNGVLTWFDYVSPTEPAP